MNKDDYKLVHAHIRELLPRLERPATHRLRAPYLSVTYRNTYAGAIYTWDHVHMAMRFASDGDARYLRFLVENLLAYQHRSGFVPSVVHEQDGPMQHSPLFHAQPFLAQSALLYVAQTKDIEWASQHVKGLRAYLGYYSANHETSHAGLFTWGEPWMSGFDNDIATSIFPAGTVVSCDLPAWMYLEFRAMTHLAQLLDDPEDTFYFRDKAMRVAEAINRYLWNDEARSYAALNIITGRHVFHFDDAGGGADAPGRYAFQSCSNLIPLYARVAPASRAETMLRRYVLSPEHFLSLHGIRSLSRSSAYYNNAIWGNPPRFGSPSRLTNSNWQGPVWFPLTYFAAHALAGYQFTEQARDLANRALGVLARCLRQRGVFTENFDGDTGTPLYAPGTASWTILADVLHQELNRGSLLEFILH